MPAAAKARHTASYCAGYESCSCSLPGRAIRSLVRYQDLLVRKLGGCSPPRDQRAKKYCASALCEHRRGFLWRSAPINCFLPDLFVFPLDIVKTTAWHGVGPSTEGYRSREGS